MFAATVTSVPEILDAQEQDRSQRAHPNEADLLRQIRMIADFMDNRFVIPGTAIRIGLDGLIGLVPGIGDVATTAVSAYIIYLAHQLDVPKHLLVRMMLNVAVDMTVGIVPVLGDVADLAWKANLKNVRLLERHLMRRQRSRNRTGNG